MASQTMRAITYRAYGGPDVLSVAELTRPQPADDEILIRVEAAEASKSDTEMRSFRYDVKWFWLPLRLALGVRRPRRSVLGIYFSGVVEAVGPDVSDFAVGDEVYGATGLRLGAYGEFVVLPARAAIAAKPASMTFAEAAAVPLGAINALHFLRRAEVEPGDSVLINGAGGVIGAYGVQVARMMGGEVTGVDAAHKETFVRSMGATDFVDYQTTDVTSLDNRYDVIFDMVPSTPVSKILGLLKPGGRYAARQSTADDTDPSAAFSVHRRAHPDRERSREPGSPQRACCDDRCGRVVQHRRPSPPDGAGVRSTSSRGHRATRGGNRPRHWARCQRTTSPERAVIDPLVDIPGSRLPNVPR